MAAGPYDRLRGWAEENGHPMTVKKVPSDEGTTWTISTSVDDPVSFSAHGSANTIDVAAEQILEDLETVGVVIP